MGVEYGKVDIFLGFHFNIISDFKQYCIGFIEFHCNIIYLIMLSIVTHSVHWGINSPPQKHHLLFLAKPPLNQQTVQAAPF